MRRSIIHLPPRRVFAGIAAAVTLALPWWLPPLGAWLIVADALEPVDAVIPLAGDPARVPAAARIWAATSTPWFVATSMPQGDNGYSATVIAAATAAGVPREAIIAPNSVALTTYGEAQIVQEVAQREGWRAVLIVTSPSHTRRARSIFRAVFAGSATRVIVQPAPNHWFAADTWWRSRAGWREVVSEYAKWAVYLLGYHTFTTNRQ